jgi:predicted small metal-binding protein
MRVIECDVCGETISGADDDELVRRLGRHHRDEHDADPEEEELAELVHEEAYDAMDS